MAEASLESTTEPLILGRYAMFGQIASGGMATVHLGCVLGGREHGREVAIKRLHPRYVKDHDFLTMFLDEARIVVRIRHPNVVATHEVVENDAGMFLVMEYVHGETFSRLLRAARTKHEVPPPPIASRVVYDALLGLHGAHETRGGAGEMLNIVHRDVSPQNVMVGTDGLARVLDFGVAKAAGRAQVTREGQIKGKITYMAPEQVRGQVDRRTDVFAAAVVLWEALAGRRLHEGLKDFEIVQRVMQGKLPRPSTFAPDVSPALDAIVMRGLAADPDKRFATAEALAKELAAKVQLASAEQVASWTEALAHEALVARRAKIEAMHGAAATIPPPAMPPPSGSSPTLTMPADRAPGAAPPAPSSAPVVAEATEERPVRGAPFGIVLTPTLHGGFTPPGQDVPGSHPEIEVAMPAFPAAPGSAPDIATRGAAEGGTFELDAPFGEPRAPEHGTSPPPAAAGGFSDPAMRPYLVALVFSVVLALIGAVLGVYALLGPRRAPPTSTPRPRPPATMPDAR